MDDRQLQTLRNMGNEAEEAADEITRLRAQVEALRKDAERYKHLRLHHYKPRSPNTEYDNSMLLSFHVSGVWSDNMDPRVLDGCIDAAIEAQKVAA